MQDKGTQQEAPQVAHVDIGALLSSQRESIGASAKTAAKAVNLSLDTLQCLESNQFDKIGTAVYVRGYLGLYAKYLRLDASQVIHIYDSQYPAQSIAIKPALAQSFGAKKQTKRHSKTLSLFVALSVFGALLYGYHRLEPIMFKGETNIVSQGDVNTGLLDDSSVQTIVDQVEGVQNLADDVLNGLPVATQSGDLVSELTLGSLDFEDTLSNTSEGVDPSLEVGLQSEDPVVVTSAEQEELNEDSVDEVSPASDTQTLQLQFKNDCWLKITDASGKVLVSGIYSAKRPVNIKGETPFYLTTARQEAIELTSLNGKPITLGNHRVSNRRYEIK